MDIDSIFSVLKRESLKWDTPVAEFIRVQTKDPFRILVSVILSARTKDEITSKVCIKLFKSVKKPSDLKKYSVKQIEKMIYPVGFYKTKAKHLKQLAPLKKVPDTIEKLIELPGVGRKTANLVLASAFGKPAIAVDTHVHKIFNRLGYVKTKTPEKTETALKKKLPGKYWLTTNRIFVAFGQHLCVPVSPFCSKCPVHDFCKRVGVEKSR